MNEVTRALLDSADEDYKSFSQGIIPGVTGILGVRAPVARAIAKRYAKAPQGEQFLRELPHTYHDEYITHAYMLAHLSREDIEAHLKRLLPYMNSWAIVDTTVGAIKQFFKDRERAWELVTSLLGSEQEYVCRFGIVSLLSYYLDGEYAMRAINEVKRVRSEKFYVKMAQAWFFATALTKQYELALPVIIGNELDAWTHNKAIQKARESLKIDKKTKDYLNTLKRR